jgi:hypothetical protein
MALTKAAARERARYAALSRDRKPDDPERLEARRNLRFECLSEHVARVVAEAPPMTDEQREQIASLLRPARQVAAEALAAGGA